MIIVRDRHMRGYSDMGGHNSRHSFSFGEYRDSDDMRFNLLRVINNDRVVPGAGVTRGEYNASKTEPVQFLQIGIVPEARGIARLNRDELREVHGARIGGERAIELDAGHRAEILLFDLK